jgi:tetratricopeptide (TPR) repeat protein
MVHKGTGKEQHSAGDHNSDDTRQKGNDTGDTPEHVLAEAIQRFRQGEYSEALELFDRAIALCPDSARAWNGRGAVLANMGYYIEALEACDTAVAMDPGYFKAWSNRGRVLGYLGRTTEALGSLDKAIRLRPEFAEAFFLRGWVLASQGRYPGYQPQPGGCGGMEHAGQRARCLRPAWGCPVLIRPDYRD